MKYQACQYRILLPPTILDGRKVQMPSEWLNGIAVIDSHGDINAHVIADENLRQLSKKPYDWRFLSGPLTFIDTDYVG